MALFRGARLCVIILFLNYVALAVSKRSAPVQTVEAIARVPDATEIDQAGKEVEMVVNDISPDGQEEYPLPDVIPESTYAIQVEPVYINGVEEVGEVTEWPSTTTVKINTPKFVPELSVRAIPVSPDTVLVTVDTAGGEKVDKLRISYADDPAINWTRVDDYNSKENYALVAGLQSSTKYFFNVCATVNKKSRCVVTHVLTPPAGFSTPTNISVTAKTDSSILITWNYDGDVTAKGFIVLIENLQSDGSVRPVKQNVVFKQNEAVVDGLDSGEKYQVKVEYFDLENSGTCSEPVLFQLNVTGETTTPEQPRQSDYKVVLKEVKQSPTKVKVKWAVNEGNLKHIRYFHVKLVTDRGRVVLNRKRKPTARSETFSRLLPQSRYFVNVQTVTARGVVDDSSVEFISSAPDSTGNRKPVLYLDIVEVRDDTAMVEFSSQNLNPQRVRRYRVRVKDLDIRALGDIILKQKSFIPGTPFILESLKPNRNYQVIIDALSRRGTELLTAIANFSTSAPGKYGTPVFTSSETSRQPQVTPDVPTSPTLRPTTIFTRRPPPTVPRSTPTTRRTPPTVPPRNVPTTAATEETTTEEPFVIVTTGQPTEEPKNHDYVMTVKIPNKTPNSVDIRWSVDRGPLENIKNFLATFKGEKGNILLSETIKENQRLMPIHSLNSSTRYFVTVKAIGPQGDLVESAVSFETGPSDAVPDTSNPVLVLEANEVRAHNTRIDWTAINTKPQLVRNYKITVLDSGRGGYNLLTQIMDRYSQSLTLQQLEPNKRYHVILEALAADNSVLMTSWLTFETPSENQYGVPVSTSSIAELQQKPVAEKLSKSQIPQQGSNQGKNDTSSDPVLEFRVNPTSIGLCWLTWSTQNMPAGLVVAYLLKIRENGPQGDVLHQSHSHPESEIRLELTGLIKDSSYFLELDALSPSGAVVLSASTLYMPGRNVTPFHVTSKLSASGLSQLQAREGGSQVDDDEGSKPQIDLELNPLGHNQVRINWTVINENRRRPIASYNVKFHQDGPEGHKLHENLLAKNTLYYTVYDLLENTRYYIQLDALDKDGRVIEYVGYTYLVPSPGHAVEPSRTPSVFNKNKVTTTVSPAKQDRLSEREELVISRVEAQGSNSILVEWHYAEADASKHAQETVVYWIEFNGNVRESEWMMFVPAGQQRLVIRGLKPDTTYGIQVAPERSDRRSKIVYRKTGPK